MDEAKARADILAGLPEIFRNALEDWRRDIPVVVGARIREGAIKPHKYGPLPSVRTTS